MITNEVVICKQYFADRDIFCAGRVTEEDLQRVAAATGGTVQTSVNNVIDEVITFKNFNFIFFFCNLKVIMDKENQS